MVEYSSAWFLRPKPNKNADLRLFCVPHVGGSAMIFRTWPQYLPNNVEVCAVELPGHGRRINEAPFSQLGSLVDALTNAILPYLDRPYAFFGHSLGALVCFELTRNLSSRPVPIPVLLCVSGAKAPQLLVDGSNIHKLPDTILLSEVRRLGGTPAAVLENEELVTALLPTFRSDFAVLETYTYSESTPIKCPILALGGVADHQVDRASLRSWVEHTTGGFNLKMFPGDHFFVYQAQSQILQIIGADLEHADSKMIEK